ncbi:MAG: hypothetical protein VCD00_02740 [Candidatus Hydrogenedentota bacterium]
MLLPPRLPAVLVITTMSLLVIPTPNAASADVGEILDSHFEAVGGLDKLSEIKTVQRTADLQLTGDYGTMLGKGTEATVIGEKSFDSMDFGPFEQSTIWNGVEGWNINSADGTTQLSGVDLDGAKSAVYVDPLQSAYKQGGKAAFVQKEDETYDGTECFVLSIVGTETAYYIDKASHLLVGFKTPTDDPDFGETMLVIQYSNYVEYGGVKFPDSTSVDIGQGAVHIEYTYTKTELDLRLDEKIFDKP